MLSLTLMQVEETRSDLLSKLSCWFLSLSDSNAFEKTILKSEGFSKLSKSGSRIKHFMCFQQIV